MIVNLFVGAFNIGLSRSEYFNLKHSKWKRCLLMKMGAAFSLSNTNTRIMKITILLLMDYSGVKD